MYISINQELKEITSYIIIFIGISDNFPYQKSCPERRREARALPQPSPHSSSSSSILELTLPPQGAGAFLRPWEGCACLCLSLIQCQPGELWRVSVHKDKSAPLLLPARQCLESCSLPLEPPKATQRPNILVPSGDSKIVSAGRSVAAAWGSL